MQWYWLLCSCLTTGQSGEEKHFYSPKNMFLVNSIELLLCELVFISTFSSFVFPLCFDIVIIQLLDLMHRRGYSTLVQSLSTRTPVGVWYSRTIILYYRVTALSVSYHIGFTTKNHISVVSGSFYMRIKHLSWAFTHLPDNHHIWLCRFLKQHFVLFIV
jgi:hypothetical protein